MDNLEALLGEADKKGIVDDEVVLKVKAVIKADNRVLMRFWSDSLTLGLLKMLVVELKTSQNVKALIKSFLAKIKNDQKTLNSRLKSQMLVVENVYSKSEADRILNSLKDANV